MSIKKVAVLGSGVMGSGIAAQIANAGHPVLFYDLEAPAGVIEAMKAQGPGGAFMDPEVGAGLLEPLSLKTDLDRVSEADWICEVIVENVKIKQDLYARIETVRKPDAILSSNTSTIPLEQLVDGRSETFKQHFVITHFFNPPRVMRLLEFVAGSDTLPDVAKRIVTFCESELGKGVVPCFDRPGFIANRIGVFWLMTALHKGLAQGIDIAAADLALNKLYGIPKTGAFGLMDLIGLDLMPKMAQSLASNLPPTDPFQAVAPTPKLLEDMVAAGFTGRKGKGGFAKMVKQADGKKTKMLLDLSRPFDAEGSYRAEEKTDPAEAWAKEVMDATLDYAHSLLGEVADREAAIDAAMVWGYGWGKGPFALRGARVMLPKPTGALRAADSGILVENEHLVLRDLGDKVALLALRTKMNTLTDDAFDLIRDILTHHYAGLVIGSDGQHFSAGANVARFLDKDAEAFIVKGQETMKAIRQAHFPVIAAVSGLAIGGGCELALHSTAIVAHAETNIGLVEPRVGVIPGWGGCLEALRRLGAPEALSTIMAQWMSQSAQDARNKGYLGPKDVIVMNRDLVISTAKSLALSLGKPGRRPFRAASTDDIKTMETWIGQQKFAAPDEAIARALARVLSQQSEDDVWAAEKEDFLKLLQTDTAKTRIAAVLAR